MAFGQLFFYDFSALQVLGEHLIIDNASEVKDMLDFTALEALAEILGGFFFHLRKIIRTGHGMDEIISCLDVFWDMG